MSADYVAVAMVACPRCKASMGAPCRVRACRNGYSDCTYAVCSYLKELPEPHLERAEQGAQLMAVTCVAACVSPVYAAIVRRGR